MYLFLIPVALPEEAHLINGGDGLGYFINPHFQFIDNDEACKINIFFMGVGMVGMFSKSELSREGKLLE